MYSMGSLQAACSVHRTLAVSGELVHPLLDMIWRVIAWTRNLGGRRRKLEGSGGPIHEVLRPSHCLLSPDRRPATGVPAPSQVLCHLQAHRRRTCRPSPRALSGRRTVWCPFVPLSCAVPSDTRPRSVRNHKPPIHWSICEVPIYGLLCCPVLSPLRVHRGSLGRSVRARHLLRLRGSVVLMRWCAVPSQDVLSRHPVFAVPS